MRIYSPVDWGRVEDRPEKELPIGSRCRGVYNN